MSDRFRAFKAVKDVNSFGKWIDDAEEDAVPEALMGSVLYVAETMNVSKLIADQIFGPQITGASPDLIFRIYEAIDMEVKLRLTDGVHIDDDSDDEPSDD